MRKTTHEIIDEIAAKYNNNNRSIDTYSLNRCMYRSSNGKECAFAYMVKPEFKDKLSEGINAISNIDFLGEKIIKDEYTGHSKQFYNDIQGLHDNKNYWNSEGLSEKGKIFVSKLKLKYPI